MLVLSGQPPAVALHYRRITDVELLSQELDHRPRHLDRVGQEPAQQSNRCQLHREPQPVVIATTISDRHPIGVTQPTTPLQIQTRRLLREPAYPPTCSSERNSTGTPPSYHTPPWRSILLRSSRVPTSNTDRKSRVSGSHRGSRPRHPPPRCIPAGFTGWEHAAGEHPGDVGV